ncbi:MAG: DUF427 domain-containing protein [Myxococcales bacterium]|nr:DUF427 domain-containing protein [Myxococcales bacterium]MDD9967682.1 DUF427 domain-containing protein [Myxococcales bacterium]
MSLTTGRGPLAPDPAGHFDRQVPAGAVYVEPWLRRVRALVGGRTAIDSERVLLVHRPGRPPEYAFPEQDVRGLPMEPEPAAQGYVRVAWDAATAWYEESERVYGHPKNPYHRIDCIRARRRLRAEIPPQVLVDTTDVVAVFETSRLPQLYAPRSTVRLEFLVPSPTSSYCPYKGTASYWTAVVDGRLFPDVAWSYDDPHPESAPIAGCFAFYADRVSGVQDVPDWFRPPLVASQDTNHDANHEANQEVTGQER